MGHGPTGPLPLPPRGVVLATEAGDSDPPQNSTGPPRSPLPLTFGNWLLLPAGARCYPLLLPAAGSQRYSIPLLLELVLVVAVVAGLGRWLWRVGPGWCPVAVSGRRCFRPGRPLGGTWIFTAVLGEMAGGMVGKGGRRGRSPPRSPVLPKTGICSVGRVLFRSVERPGTEDV